MRSLKLIDRVIEMPIESTFQETEITDQSIIQAFTGSSTQEDEVSLYYYLPSNLKQRRLIPRPYHDLPPVFQFDNMSSIAQIRKIRDELISTKESYRRDIPRLELLKSASQLIDKLIGEEDIFQNIDKKRLLGSLSDLINKLSHEETSIPDDVFVNRIEKIMALEAMSGILEDFTPEQLDEFETETKRRPFFK